MRYSPARFLRALRREPRKPEQRIIVKTLKFQPRSTELSSRTSRYSSRKIAPEGNFPYSRAVASIIQKITTFDQVYPEKDHAQQIELRVEKFVGPVNQFAVNISYFQPQHNIFHY
jgi:hypothetical protein